MPPKIVPIVEGHGDVVAVPILLRRILQEKLINYQWGVDGPIRAGRLSLPGKDARYIHLALCRPECGGVLVLLDLDDGCPKDKACHLADQIRQLHPSKPVAVVFAHREYETWFLASIESLAGHYGLPEHLRYEGDPEDRRDAKGWLKNKMHGEVYEETYHQPKMTSHIDIDLAFQRSRSFRRLIHAVEQIIQAGETLVTPNRCDT